MIIFVLRHGMTTEAEADELRQLSEKGVEEVEAIVNRRPGAMGNVSHIYSSPLLRVRQTLNVAARILNYKNDIEETNYLKTGSRLKEIVSFLEELDLDSGDILVSSHQSCTSILVLWLTGEDILISNGSLLAIEVNEITQGAGKLLWQESQSGSEVKRTTDFVDQF